MVVLDASTPPAERRWADVAILPQTLGRLGPHASMTLLRDLTETGTGCLLATHNGIAFGAAARVLELRDGLIALA